MITNEMLFAIGFVAKTHGVKGELNIALDTDFNPEDFRFLIFELESIYVPFELASSRGRGQDNRFVSIAGVDNVDEARQFVGKTVYVLRSELENHPDYEEDGNTDEQGLYLSDLVGYELFDESNLSVGIITGFNDDTQNYLLEVELPENRKVFIPFVEDWLLELDRDNKKIIFELPEGLID